jgi:LuxR family transcriptional regulator/LuxR family quorum-sensing system transcriptional regulator CciR
MQDFVTTVQKAQSAYDLREALAAFVAPHGIEYLGYMVVRRDMRRVPVPQGAIFGSYPKEWVQNYAALGLEDDDPFLLAAIRLTAPMRWLDLHRVQDFTPRVQQILDFHDRHGLRDGWVVPLFGARGSVALMTFATGTPQLNLTAAEVERLRLASHVVHGRHLVLTGEEEASPYQLSPREVEVLTWVVRGKSNASIAGILGISEHTVDTLLRRTFRKLEVTDRVSAALVAVGTGLVIL